MARLDLISHGAEDMPLTAARPTPCSNSASTTARAATSNSTSSQAHKWFNLAALRGNEDAKRHRLEIAKEMSRDDISRAQKLAREWIATH